MNTILNNGSEIALVLRILSCVILLGYCIPLQIKEAGVKNGLSKLRIQLLAFGLILLFTNAITIHFLGTRIMYGIKQSAISSWLQLANAASFFSLSVLGFIIYNTQYTEEHIKDSYERAKKREETKKNIT